MKKENLNVVWKQIQFEPNYEVSNTGLVRNIKTHHIKNQRYDRYGYLRITLYPSNKTYSIHRLVMLTFLPDLVNESINHIDGNKDNNNITNLEWCTVKHNNIHRSKMHPDSQKGELNAMAKITTDVAKKIKYGSFPGLNNREIGDLYSVSSEVVRRIRSGQRWKHI